MENAVSRIKIGFVGPGGTGKTTLAELLAKELKLPMHPSVNRAVFARFGQTQINHMQLPPIRRWQIQQASFAARIEQAEKNLPGIYERTLLDHYMYCLLYCYEVINDKQLNYMEKQVEENLARFDLLFYFPMYTNWPEAHDGFRDATLSNRRLQELILHGFLEESPATYRKITIPNELPATRLAIVLKQIKNLYYV